MSKMSGTFLHVFTASGAGKGAVDGTEFGVVEALLSRTLLLLILRTGLVFTTSCVKCRKTKRTMVSGYSICTTLMFLTSSGESKPNWISWIVFSGALDGVKLKFDILAVVFSAILSMCDLVLAGYVKWRHALLDLSSSVETSSQPLQAFAADDYCPDIPASTDRDDR